MDARGTVNRRFLIRLFAGFFFDLSGGDCILPLMKTRKAFFRVVAGTLAALTLSVSMVQCFGGFPLTKTIYKFNKSVGDGSLGGRFIQELVMILLVIIPVYGIGMLVDLIVFNLIEFWTGKPIMSANLSSPDGRISFHAVTDNEMRIDIKTEKGPMSLYVFRDRPGEFYAKNGNDYLRVEMPAELKGFDAKGNTTVSCSKEAAVVRCVEGDRTATWMKSTFNRKDYQRTENLVRAQLALPVQAAVR